MILTRQDVVACTHVIAQLWNGLQSCRLDSYQAHIGSQVSSRSNMWEATGLYVDHGPHRAPCDPPGTPWGILGSKYLHATMRICKRINDCYGYVVLKWRPHVAHCDALDSPCILAQNEYCNEN